MWPSKRVKLCVNYFMEDDFSSMATWGSLIPSIITSKNSLLLLFDDVHSRMPFFYEDWVFQYLDIDFFSHFRMRKSSFNKLLSELGTHYTSPPISGGNHPLPLEKSTLVCLWYLANGDVMFSIADRFRISVSTVHDCVSLVIDLLKCLLPVYVKWPREQECAKIELAFREAGGYPGVIGAIDGCHFRAKIPVNQHDSYQDRKFQHSISIQAICNPQILFTNVSIGYPGSLHDARILRESRINQICERFGPEALFYNNKYHLVGDSAYPCRTWLMTPYRDNGHLTRAQRKHNFILSRTRVKIENSFGNLKGRWRILLNINVYSVKRAISIIRAGIVLNDFCVLCREMAPVFDENFEDHPGEDEDIDQQGIERRNGICVLLNRALNQ